MRLLLLLPLLTILLFVTGCSTNKEDQAFFEKGWWSPEKAAEQRMYGTRAPENRTHQSDRPQPPPPEGEGAATEREGNQ
jgi:hypothetical protein